MGDGLIIVSKRSNCTFIMLHVYEMDVDYLAVEEMFNIKSCLITLSCLE
jgi:hypothetical protein